MFTGLVESLATVNWLKIEDGITKLSLSIDEPQLHGEPMGASIAVNGCCLTVCEITKVGYVFDVGHTTMDVTNLGLLDTGKRVNVERAMKLGDRLGGHLVSGHIDGTGIVKELAEKPDGWLLKVHLPAQWSRHVISKGSICIDGTSLTISALTDDETGTELAFMIIPTTLEHTIVSTYQPGQKVNIEVDMISKFIQRQQEVP